MTMSQNQTVVKFYGSVELCQNEKLYIKIIDKFCIWVYNSGLQFSFNYNAWIKIKNTHTIHR